MLFNLKWNRTAPSRAGFIAWLETKNPRGRYEWAGCSCAIHQYLEAIGSTFTDATYHMLEGKDSIAMKRPHTFGALLKRARDASNKGDF